MRSEAVNQMKEGQATQWPKEKDKSTNTDQQNITQKTKDRATRTPLNARGILGCSRRLAITATPVATVALLLLQTRS
jgi:hypothetical protein